MGLRMQDIGKLLISDEVRDAMDRGWPIVALETAVLTHGLPVEVGEEIFGEMLSACWDNGAVPAPASIVGGAVRIGLSEDEIAKLGGGHGAIKLGVRDIPFAIAEKATGGMTVSATLRVCAIAGIEVMATGGIGGVHTGVGLDVSSDLFELARTPALCVCSGPKSVLDVPATYELIESLGIPMASYRSDELPSFYSRSSGIPSPWNLGSPEEVARSFAARRTLLGDRGMLLVNPLDGDLSIDHAEINSMLSKASRGSRGKDVTPSLLSELATLSNGRTVKANRALLVSNASLAARVAGSLVLGRPLD